MYTIKRAAEQVGVSESTLRAWERRYGVGAARRTEAGYRLYDKQAVRALNLMRALVDDGWSVRAAAEETHHRMEVGSPRVVALPSVGADEDDTHALIRIAAALDAPALTELLDRRFSAASFETVVDQWLLPALHALGTAWEARHVTVAGEHMVAHGVTRRLAAAYDAAGDNRSGPRVLLGLPPGSRHELGVLAFSTAARRAGLATTYLGADVPITDWVAAAAHGGLGSGVACAVLAAPMETDGTALRDTADALRAGRPDLIVAVGGSAQDLAPPECVKLGHQVGPAANFLAERLASRA